MALEITDTIAGLDLAAPLSGDRVSEADNHLRLIKAVLKNIFPGSGGDGFEDPILATEAELNYSQGLTSNIQDQIDALVPAKFTVGTLVVFAQAAAPTHWTQITTNNNRMLRVVNDGTGGDVGGLHSPILMNLVPSHTHSDTFAGSTSSAGSHNHTYVDAYYASDSAPFGSGFQGPQAIGQDSDNGLYTRTGTTDSDGAHTHTLTLTGSVGTNTGADNWEPLYLNVIVCEFDG